MSALVIGVAIGVLLTVSYFVGHHAGRRGERVRFEGMVHALVAEVQTSSTLPARDEPEHRHAA